MKATDYHRKYVRVANLLGLTVGRVAAGVTCYLGFKPLAETLGGADPWWTILLAPAVIGLMLVGGVHGGAPEWLLVVGPSVSCGVVWGMVARTITRIVVRPRDPAAWQA